MRTNIKFLLEKTKKQAEVIANLSARKRKNILLDIAKEITKDQEKILHANAKDVFLAQKNKKKAPFIDRLTLDKKRIATIVSQVKHIARQEDVTRQVIEEKVLDSGILLKKIRVPLGVIAIIYESRPNVTIDATALCIKSGNAVVLRGGSDSLFTNFALVECVWNVLKKYNISESMVTFIADTNRKKVGELLKAQGLIDVVIPRGGYGLVEKVVNESKVPMLYHASGGARIYVDKSADIKKAVDICVNAKVQRPGVCNALDTVVVHKEIADAFLPLLYKEMEKYNVEIREEDFATEFLDRILAIKIVENVEEALKFIKHYSHGHSEGVIAEDTSIIKKFVCAIDAAGLFVNCSTRFHDGSMFGLGAEMGIATGKLHARGPVGAKELTTYKWVAYGNGQVRI